MKRTILAFLFSPIISSFILAAITVIISRQSLADILGFAVNYSFYAYIVTFVLGLPTYLLIYKANNLRNYWQFLLGGLSLSIVPFLFFSIIFAPNIRFLITCLLLGAITGSVFWLIGEKEKNSIQSANI